VERKRKKRARARIYLRPSSGILEYIDQLAELGVHGQTPTEVAEGLIGREVERLIKEDFLLKARESLKPSK
jgi:hypothetical protein